eukprot:gene12046-14232_t
MQDEARAIEVVNALKDFLLGEGGNEFADVELQGLDAVSVHAVRAIISARSPVFRGMFYGQFKEAGMSRADLPFDAATIRNIVEFCYTDDAAVFNCESSVDVRELVSLIIAGEYLDMPSLKKRSRDAAKASLPESACVLLEATSLCNPAELSELNALAFNTICRMPTLLVKNRYAEDRGAGDVRTLSFEMLLKILSTKQINATEAFLFQALRRWSGTSDITLDETSWQTVEFNRRSCRKDENVPEEEVGCRVVEAMNLVKHLDLERMPAAFLAAEVSESHLVTWESLFTAFVSKALKADEDAVFRAGALNLDFPRYSYATWESSCSDVFQQDTSPQYSVQCLDNVSLSAGVHSWKLKIMKLGRANQFWVGVLQKAYDPETWDGKQRSGGGMLYGSNGAAYRICYKNGINNDLVLDCENLNRPGFLEGDELTLTLDLTKGSTCGPGCRIWAMRAAVEGG